MPQESMQKNWSCFDQRTSQKKITLRKIALEIGNF